MVLLDEQGGKIHASIRKTYLYKFQPLLLEGRSYIMNLYRGIENNNGDYRTTRHPYKLNFQYRTSVRSIPDLNVSLYGISCTPFNEVIEAGVDTPYLIDIIGIMTVVGPERSYSKEGKKTPMRVIQLEDDSIMLECALFGRYVDQLNQFLASGETTNIVVIVQFAKVNLYKGNIGVQNVLDATRIFFNPNLPEAVDFRKSLHDSKKLATQQLSQFSDHSSYSIDDDFLRITPRKTIEHLKNCEPGTDCIILATIKYIEEGDKWFYNACKCNKSVRVLDDMYYCDKCNTHVLTVIPRYILKVIVDDEFDCASFVIFDREATILLGKTCVDMLEQVRKVGGNIMDVPPDVKKLVNKMFLFKVEVKSSTFTDNEHSFRVKRLSDDLSLIQKFKDMPINVVDETPTSNRNVHIGHGTSTDYQTIEKNLLSQFSENQGETSSTITPSKRGFEEIKESPGYFSSYKSKELKLNVA